MKEHESELALWAQVVWQAMMDATYGAALFIRAGAISGKDFASGWTYNDRDAKAAQDFLLARTNRLEEICEDCGWDFSYTKRKVRECLERANEILPEKSRIQL